MYRSSVVRLFTRRSAPDVPRQETAHGRCQSGRKPRLNDASRRLQALLGALSLGTFASLRPRSSPCTPFAVGSLSSASASASSSGPGRQRWLRLRESATSRLRPEEPRRPERCPESLGACLGGRRLASAPQVSLVRAHGITVGTSALSQTKDENPAFAVFLELFVHSTLWMSFCLASLVPFVQLECAAQLDWQPFWAAACESVSVYTLDHLRDIRKATASTGSNKRPLNQGGLARHRRTFLRVLLGAGLAGFVGSLLAARSWRVTLTFGGHILLCFAYAKLKKSMPYLKAPVLCSARAATRSACGLHQPVDEDESFGWFPDTHAQACTQLSMETQQKHMHATQLAINPEQNTDTLGGKAFYVSLCVLFMAVAAPSAYAPSLSTAKFGSSYLKVAAGRSEFLFGFEECFCSFELLLCWAMCSICNACIERHIETAIHGDVPNRCHVAQLQAGVVTLPSGLGPSNARIRRFRLDLNSSESMLFVAAARVLHRSLAVCAFADGALKHQFAGVICPAVALQPAQTYLCLRSCPKASVAPHWIRECLRVVISPFACLKVPSTISLKFYQFRFSLSSGLKFYQVGKPWQQQHKLRVAGSEVEVDAVSNNAGEQWQVAVAETGGVKRMALAAASKDSDPDDLDWTFQVEGQHGRHFSATGDRESMVYDASVGMEWPVAEGLKALYALDVKRRAGGESLLPTWARQGAGLRYTSRLGDLKLSLHQPDPDLSEPGLNYEAVLRGKLREVGDVGKKVLASSPEYVLRAAHEGGEPDSYSARLKMPGHRGMTSGLELGLKEGQPSISGYAEFAGKRKVAQGLEFSAVSKLVIASQNPGQERLSLLPVGIGASADLAELVPGLDEGSSVDVRTLYKLGAERPALAMRARLRARKLAALQLTAKATVNDVGEASTSMHLSASTAKGFQARYETANDGRGLRQAAEVMLRPAAAAEVMARCFGRIFQDASSGGEAASSAGPPIRGRCGFHGPEAAGLWPVGRVGSPQTKQLTTHRCLLPAVQPMQASAALRGLGRPLCWPGPLNLSGAAPKLWERKYSTGNGRTPRFRQMSSNVAGCIQ
ncbi:unnamed protein product [Polarella glacialis]|uniref:Uncharacterized protein n=1 Tax=Polarella glacialis TaxID=89957 RepID=A0A813I9W5_POLGL|nr:unnamed protein product [Polarella glacialis]